MEKQVNSCLYVFETPPLILPLAYAGLSSSSDLLSPRHMKRYIGQLVHAKSVCEKRLQDLDSDLYSGNNGDDEGSAAYNLGVRKSTGGPVSFAAVMNSAFTRY